MKRSMKFRPVTIGLIGLGAFALSACREERVDVSVVRDEGSCLAIPGATMASCAASREAAEKEHLASAPRYDALKVCEEQHGEGQCVSETGSGGGSIFMPLMMGYLAGKMLGGTPVAEKERRSAQAGGGNVIATSRPLYATGRGGMATAGDGVMVQPGQTSVSVTPGGLKSAPVTAGKPPMSAASVKSTGGFGGRAIAGG